MGKSPAKPYQKKMTFRSFSDMKKDSTVSILPVKKLHKAKKEERDE